MARVVRSVILPSYTARSVGQLGVASQMSKMTRIMFWKMASKLDTRNLILGHIMNIHEPYEFQEFFVNLNSQ
jgi:hypothetical protein